MYYDNNRVQREIDFNIAVKHFCNRLLGMLILLVPIGWLGEFGVLAMVPWKEVFVAILILCGLVVSACALIAIVFGIIATLQLLIYGEVRIGY